MSETVSVPLSNDGVWPLRGIASGPNKGGVITSEFFKSYGNVPKKEALKVAYVAICYMVLFSGYYYVHAFTSSTFRLSYVGFAIQYFFYAVASLLGPSFGRRFGLKLIIVLSSLGYILYCGAVISRIDALYLVSAAIIGICAGFIWLQQGIYIAGIAEQIRNETTFEVGGALSGLFYGLFNFCFIFGNLISLIALLSGVQTYIIQWVMFGVCSLGVIMLFFIRVDEPQPESRSLFFSHFKERVKAVLGIIKVKGYWLVIPLVVLQSVQISITYQVIPRLIGSKSPSTILYHIVTFIFYGIGSVIASFLTGKLFDKSSSMAWIIMSSCEISANVLLVCLQEGNIPIEVWWCVGFLRGSSDYALTTIISSIGIRTFKEHSTPFFASYRLIYCICYVPISIMTGYVVYYVNVLMCLGLWVLATAGFYVLNSTKFNSPTG